MGVGVEKVGGGGGGGSQRPRLHFYAELIESRKV